MYVFAGCYCLTAPIRFINRYDDLLYSLFPPNGILWVAELPGWFFLLWQFKRGDLLMNSAALADTVGSYWRYVWKNILKFFGVCLGFCAVSFCFTAVCMFADESATALTFSVLLSILLVGLNTWLSFSAEYLLYSLGERSSDRAKEKGIFSGFTKGFVIAAVILAILAAFCSNFSSFMFDGTHKILMPSRFSLGELAALLSYISNSVGTLSTFVTLTATVYLFSEFRTLKDRRLDRTFNLMIFLTLLLMVLRSLVTRLLTSVILIQENLYGSSDTLYRLINLNNLCVAALSLAALALTSVCYLLLCLRIAGHGYARKGWIWLPLAMFFCGFWVNLFAMIGRASSIPGAALLEAAGSIITGFFELFYLLKIMKKVKEKPMLPEA